MHYFVAIKTVKRVKPKFSLVLWLQIRRKTTEFSGVFMQECNQFRWKLTWVFLLNILSRAVVPWKNRKDYHENYEYSLFFGQHYTRVSKYFYI